MGLGGVPITRDLALNERNYGDLNGLNKDDARKKWGEEQVLQWRRSYDVPPPGGESLKDTIARALPYYVQNILPGVLNGRRTIIAAHGNSLRALVMVLERAVARADPQARTRDRRADHLPAQRRLDGCFVARPGVVERRSERAADTSATRFLRCGVCRARVGCIGRGRVRNPDVALAFRA